MVVIKWQDAIKSPRVKLDVLMCVGLYQDDLGFIIPLSVTDPDTKLN